MKRIKPFVLAYVGFTTYIAIEVLFRYFTSGVGYTTPMMGILGSIILILVDQINNRISWHLDLLVQGILGSAIVTSAELLVGTVAKAMGIQPIWDYSNLPFNYNGVICLQFSVAWVFVSIFGIFLADAINYYFLGEEPCPHYHIGKLIFKFKER